MKYKIYYTERKNLCTPSGSYYARGNDWSSEDCVVLTPFRNNNELFNSPEEAIEFLKKNDCCGEFTILPIISL